MDKNIYKIHSLMEKIDKSFVLSEVNNLLLEAMSVDDVYTKYYSNIKRGDFDQIVKADPTTPENGSKTGKFVKWLLGLYTSNNLKLEDLYKANEYLETYIKFFNKVPQEYKDINKIKSLPELFNVIKEFIDNPEQATSKSDERRKVKENEAEVFYEDSVWKVIIPKTEAAACEYGKNTQWCTASTSSDNRFEYYNEQGPLYVLINKQNHEKYQFHFESEQFMDEEDDSIEILSLNLPIALLEKFPLHNLKVIDNWIYIDGEFKDTSSNDKGVYSIDSNGYIYNPEGNAINIYSKAIKEYNLPKDIIDYLLTVINIEAIDINGKTLLKTNEVRYGVYILINDGNHYIDYNIDCFGVFNKGKVLHSIFDEDFSVYVRAHILQDKAFQLIPIKFDDYTAYISEKTDKPKMGDYAIIVKPNYESLIVSRDGFVSGDRSKYPLNALLNYDMPFKIKDFVLKNFLYNKEYVDDYVVYRIDTYPWHGTFIYNEIDGDIIIQKGRNSVVLVNGENVKDLGTMVDAIKGNSALPYKLAQYFF